MAEKKNKGEWIKDGTWYKCSECGAEGLGDIIGDPFMKVFEPIKSNFCYNCGADMREEDQNGKRCV